MLPERLKEARKAKKLSQEKMASLLFLSQQAYAKYEVGTAKPNSETLVKIAAILNVSVDYLLGIEFGTRNPAENLSEVKLEMIDLIERLSDAQVSKLLQIANAALDL
jgi:transcriptional regulator with XRE-family HTH domain